MTVDVLVVILRVTAHRLLNQPCFHQKRDGPVNRRAGNSVVLLPDLLIELISVEVIVRFEHRLQDRFPRACHLESLPIKELGKYLVLLLHERLAFATDIQSHSQRVNLFLRSFLFADEITSFGVHLP